MDYARKDNTIILTMTTAESVLLAKEDASLAQEFQVIVVRLTEQVRRQRLASLAALPDDDRDLAALVEKAQAL